MKTLKIVFTVLTLLGFALALGLLVVGVLRYLHRSIFQEQTFNRKVAIRIIFGVLALNAAMSCFDLPRCFFLLWLVTYLPADPVMFLLVVLGVRPGMSPFTQTFVSVICSLFSAVFWAALIGVLLRHKSPPNRQRIGKD
jgi:uncharacterized protein (DUF849 family)